MSLQNRKQELMGQIDRVMAACTITPDQVVGYVQLDIYIGLLQYILVKQ